MTKGCHYCGAENFGEGFVLCRGCGCPMVLGPGRERNETLAIAEAVNEVAREQVVFGARVRPAQGNVVTFFPCSSGLRRSA